MTWIEPVAVVFGVACVILTIRQNIWCWPTGLVQVALYIFIFYKVKLYSDLLLHGIYVVLQIYGWYHWLHGGTRREILRVSTLGIRSRIALLAITVLGTAGWGHLMGTLTDASVPYGDAFTTVASLIAQWLMARKHLESWLLWIVVDVVAIGIYWYKELHLTCGLYAVFLMLASLGWFSWKKSIVGTVGTAK